MHLLRHLLRETQHVAPVQQHAQRRGRPGHDLSLNLRERHQIKPGRRMVPREPVHQLHRQIDGGAFRIWHAVKVHERDLATASHEPVGGDRRIDPGAEERDHPTRASDGKTVQPFAAISVHEESVVQNLDMDLDPGLA